MCHALFATNPCALKPSEVDMAKQTVIRYLSTFPKATSA